MQIDQKSYRSGEHSILCMLQKVLKSFEKLIPIILLILSIIGFIVSNMQIDQKSYRSGEHS